MYFSARCPILKAKLGDDGLLELSETLDSAKGEWEKDLLDRASDRFERRLSDELGAFRVEMAREFALVRTEMAREFGLVRTEMAYGQTTQLRWLVGVLLTGLAANFTMLSFFLRALKP